MSNSLTVEVRAALKPLSLSSLYVTVGNDLRGDDGAGPYLARKLKDTPGVNLIDAGGAPENMIESAVSRNPDKIIVIDAADFGATPGEVRLIESEAIPASTLSTHTIPLNLITAIISHDTGAAIVFIGIQAGDVSFGKPLSSAVREAADRVSEVIRGYAAQIKGCCNNA